MILVITVIMITTQSTPTTAPIITPLQLSYAVCNQAWEIWPYTSMYMQELKSIFHA